MAEPLPSALAIPEISRFVKRANQLRSIKPALAYWCEYHAVNVIVAKNLHTTDDATFNFTKTLIDRLESTKTERADDDAIVDNTAGQAYVEQFAQETFDRAERVLRADKVTRQTADTFDAAATFFDLGNEWGPVEPETLQKIKFAKWNAARILKAIREGKDPNESNPKVEEEEEDGEGEQAAAGLDADDPEVRALTGLGPPTASVEEVPDAAEPAPGSVPAERAQPSPGASAHNDYFPPAPSNIPEPFAPSPLSQNSGQPGIPPPSAPDFPQRQPSPQIRTQSIPGETPQAVSPGTDPSAPPSWTNTPSASHAPHVTQPPASTWTPPPVANPAPVPTVSSHKDIDKAQKHAKWAISALNFDDVPTAVMELRNALAALGVQ